MSLHVVTDRAGVAAAQEASAAGYAVARNAYYAHLASGDPTAEQVVESQQAAKLLDDEMVAAWTWWKCKWTLPGDEVALGRGLVYPSQVNGEDDGWAHAYTSSNASMTGTWLEVSDGQIEATAHCSPEEAVAIAQAVAQFALVGIGQDANEIAATWGAPIPTSYGHLVTVSLHPENESIVRLAIDHDGSQGSKEAHARVELRSLAASKLAYTLRRLGTRGQVGP